MKCPNCKSENHMLVNDVSQWINVYMCMKCGVLFTSTIIKS